MKPATNDDAVDRPVGGSEDRPRATPSDVLPARLRSAITAREQAERDAVIQEAQELLSKITPGEWRVSMTGYSVKSNDDDMPIVASNPHGAAMREKDAPAWLVNADFIAAAPRLVRDLLAALTRLLAEQAQVKQERDALKAELESWKTCVNCHEPLSAPGICDKAVTEREKGLESMYEQAIAMRDEAMAQRDALVQALKGAEAVKKFALDELTRIASEIYREWDSDNDPRVGKLLAALAGATKYRHDIDQLRAALASVEGQ